MRIDGIGHATHAQGSLLACKAHSERRLRWLGIGAQGDNPGVWLLHCHLTAHFAIGQALYIVEAPELIGPPPSDYPVCPSTCEYSEGPYTIPYVNQKYGDSGFETSDENNN